MTGIELLRDYAKSLKDKYHYDKVRIEAIARQIEREMIPKPGAIFDADGAPIEIDDTVWDVRGLGPYTVHSFEGGGSAVYVEEPERCGISVAHMVKPDTLTHRKPEPPDSWERIEEDAQKRCCEYFNPCPGDEESEGVCADCRCMTKGYRCNASQRLDIVRRCRALAEKEAGRG